MWGDLGISTMITEMQVLFALELGRGIFNRILQQTIQQVTIGPPLRVAPCATEIEKGGNGYAWDVHVRSTPPIMVSRTKNSRGWKWVVRITFPICAGAVLLAPLGLVVAAGQ